jgi:integrase
VKISVAIDEILVTQTPLLRESTQAKHRIFLPELRNEIGDYTLAQFDRKKYMAWLADFKKRKPKRKTFDDYTKFINIIFRYAFNERYFAFLASFPKVDPDKGNVGRVYTQAELIRMWSVARNSPDLALKFVLGFECFMRRAEIIRLDVSRIDRKKKFIRLRAEDVKTGSKTKKGRLVPLSPFADELIEKRLKNLDSPFLFPSPNGKKAVGTFRRAWSTLLRKAKISGRARFHDLRHTALTMGINEKNLPHMKLTQVAGLSIETLERVYLHEQIEHLREITRAISIRDVA